MGRNPVSAYGKINVVGEVILNISYEMHPNRSLNKQLMECHFATNLCPVSDMGILDLIWRFTLTFEEPNFKKW